MLQEERLARGHRHVGVIGERNPSRLNIARAHHLVSAFRAMTCLAVFVGQSRNMVRVAADDGMETLYCCHLVFGRRGKVDNHRAMVIALMAAHPQVAEALERDAHTIGDWLEVFRQKDPAGLAFEQAGGSPVLSSAQRIKLKAAVQDAPPAAGIAIELEL